MTYRLGIDVGATHTTWATIAGTADGAVDSGSIESVLGVAADGQLVGGTGLATATSYVRDFVPRLGDSAPVMVGTTPYGAEALVARLVATVLDTARSRQGGDPLAVVMVHDDGLDPYRSGLLSEAARLAGVAPGATVLVPRSEATATAGAGASAAAGAARTGWSRVPDPAASAAGSGAALGVAGGAAAAATGVGAAALIADGGAATAGAAAPGVAGPAGTPLSPAGPGGTPLQPAGPTGTPLQPAGPTGTPLQPAGPAGPTGTPLQPAGPTGTPLQPPAAGPTGTTLPGAAPATPPVDITTGIGVPKPKVPKWVTIAAGGAAVVAVGVGVAVIAGGGDDSPSSQPADTVVVQGTDAQGNTVTSVVAATDPAGTIGAQEFDLSPVLGTWIQPCEPFLDGSGASQGSMTVESPGPNQLNLVIAGGDAASADCSGGFETAITVIYPLTVVQAGTSGDVVGFVVEGGEPTCESIEPAACDLVLGTGGPTPNALGVDGSGQLVTAQATGGAFPTTWEVMVEGSVRS